MSQTSNDHLTRALGEVNAMRTIAEALAHLPDDEARRRVWQWAGEHFVSAAGTPGSREHDHRDPPTSRSGGERDDLSLAVDNDLFESAVGAVEPLPDADELPADESDETVHREDTVLGDAREAGGLESMLRDFAADFRRLALAWQVA